MASKKWNLERLRSESSYWRSCILITAAHLDLFNWMGQAGKKFRSAGCSFWRPCGGWEMFLQALCGMGLMRKRGVKFSNSPFSSRYLSRGRSNFAAAQL